ncbi:unnamed protein product, partial [Polarella glacialis]
MGWPGSKGGQCCPICSQSFLGTSLKYHIKTCARQALANLTNCQFCGRPVRKEDQVEHSLRCKTRCRKESKEPGALAETLKGYQEKANALRVALSKIESGELGSLDARGCFVCGVCGQQGLGLAQIVGHEEVCRQRLSQEGRVPVADKEGQDGGEDPFSVQLAEEMAALRQDILSSCGEAAADAGEKLVLCLDRLRDIVRNACFREEKKYRRLRLSNETFAE